MCATRTVSIPAQSMPAINKERKAGVESLVVYEIRDEVLDDPKPELMNELRTLSAISI